MVSEYLLQNYQDFPYTMGQPLGALDSKLVEKQGYSKALGLSRPFRPEVDAVVILPRYLVLVEAKVWNIMNGLSKLPFYKSLVPFTPELQQYLPREIIMEIVVGWTNNNLEIMARTADIRVKIYCPDWLKGVVDSMHNYWTAAYRQQREQKIALREYFGVE